MLCKAMKCYKNAESNRCLGKEFVPESKSSSHSDVSEGPMCDREGAERAKSDVSVATAMFQWSR